MEKPYQQLGSYDKDGNYVVLASISAEEFKKGLEEAKGELDLDSYEALVQQLGMYPQIDAGRFGFNGNAYVRFDQLTEHDRVIEAEEFQFSGETAGELEELLRIKIREYIYGKQHVFVRVMPEVTKRYTYDGYPNGFIGYARIAAWSDDE